MVKPYLKWAGGKRQLLEEIKKHIPYDIKSHTYYEPFVGAGAVFFALKPQKAIINDLNSQLIFTYNAIKENVDDLIVLLKGYENKNNSQYYYEIRNADRDAQTFNVLPNTEKAARMIYLNKTCYNGLYRVNSSGFFNVPFGRYKNPVICEEILLRQISDYFNSNKITILNGDFECVLKTADKKSFVYLDPPYYSADKTHFTSYQAEGFGVQEQERLCYVVKELTVRGVKCLLSNSDSPFIRTLYGDEIFKIISVKAKRFINADSCGRGEVNEVLIKNF
ncbi:MAG: DNA adenine methylase [Treponema sp.]|jgi:DNA adenine methylase|nr:DNA adenine methylase [Treponema sp.]